MPSACVSLPGPEQRSRRAPTPARARASASMPVERLERPDQHRGADALGLADGVQQGVDAVGAVDVGACPAAPKSVACARVSPT